MPRPRHLAELITLNETQLTEGGARTRPDHWTQSPGDMKACRGHDWAYCQSSTRPGVSQQKFQDSQSGQLSRQVTFSATQPGIPRDGHGLRICCCSGSWRSLRPQLQGPILLVGRGGPRRIGQAPLSPGHGSGLAAISDLRLWPIVSSWRPRACSSWP